MPEAVSRPAWAEVDLDAVRYNTTVLAKLAAPASLCAVVKADGYGHGAVPAARATLAAGASSLAVAVVEEGVELRQAGITAPILLLAEPPAEAMPQAVAHDLTPTVYTPEGADAAARAVPAGRAPLPVHVKVDTGMRRVGVAPDAAVALARGVAESPALRLEGLWTHLAVAEDATQHAFTAEQLRRFETVRDRLSEAGIQPSVLHAANSAGVLAHPGARYDLVRCGISLYGYSPGPDLSDAADLRPALSLKARVSFVKEVAAGERLSYGLRYQVRDCCAVATVPLGYADGVPRRLSEAGGRVLIRGQPRPIAGTVTMDQLLADCGPGSDVSPGDEVVLIGRQGEAQITADEWVRLLEHDTISYEILCGVGPRVPRVYVGAEPGDEGRQGVLA